MRRLTTLSSFLTAERLTRELSLRQVCVVSGFNVALADIALPTSLRPYTEAFLALLTILAKAFGLFLATLKSTWLYNSGMFRSFFPHLYFVEFACQQ